MSKASAVSIQMISIPVDDISTMIILEISDIYRVGRLTINQPHDHILRVLEIDISDLDLTSANVRGIVPEGAPSIDGVVICYDSSEDSSFDKVEAVLRKYWIETIYATILTQSRVCGTPKTADHRTGL